ncbi:MAG: hypothetical protein BWK78_00725 [Thiotrichaceae bacterium IS1]|nr:MAG: hypothetical protein BWK78_00725 [Thiotrichaceae bacterium IS1]
MKSKHFFSRLTLTQLLFSVCIFGLVTTTETKAADAVEGQFIIKYRPCDKPIDSGPEIPGASVLSKFPSINAQLLQVSQSSSRGGIDSDPESIISKLSGDPCIEYIEPNYLLTMDETPILSMPPTLRKQSNDPDSSKNWGLAQIYAEQAWDVQTASSVIIAVIDTGVDYTHPDLKASMWVNLAEISDDGIDNDGNGCIDDVYGCDFTEIIGYDAGKNPIYSGNPMDDHSHGTHIAGIIAAVGNNGVGSVGVNWSGKIMALKAVSEKGTHIEVSDVVSAIAYAKLNGAKIINCSWHLPDDTEASTLSDAINDAKKAGILFVVAAGNEARDLDVDGSPQYPVSWPLDNIISVAGTDHEDKLYYSLNPGNDHPSGSNYGLFSVDLGAPGAEIYSTVLNHGYDYLSGTSMATPFVAGVASLLWSVHPEWTYRQVKETILASVDKVPALEGNTVTGGRLNANNAIHSPPPPTIEGPIAVCTPFIKDYTVTVDAAGSSGNIKDYRWKTAMAIDAVNEEKSPTGDKFTVTFKKEGTYSIDLTVTDEEGRSNETTCTVKVPSEPPRPPQCITASTTEGSAPLSIHLVGPQSVKQCGPIDSDEAVAKSDEAVAKYAWEICKQDRYGSCSPISFNDKGEFEITIESSGTYIIKLKVDGNSQSAKHEITVNVTTPLPNLGLGVGNDFAGNPVVPTTTTFAGGVSVGGGDYQSSVTINLDDSVTVTGEIKVDPKHVGQLADMVVYAEFPTPEGSLWFMLDKDGIPLGWDRRPATLMFFKPQVELKAVQPLSLYNGKFVLPGTLRVFFGYRLQQNGTLITNPNPIEISIK